MRYRWVLATTKVGTYNLGGLARCDDALSHFAVVDLVEIDTQHSLLLLAILVLLDNVPFLEHSGCNIIEHKRLWRRAGTTINICSFLHG